MQSALFLYNKQAGKGNIDLMVERIVAIFADHDWAVEPEAIDFTRNPFDAHPSVDMVVVAGGDGTVNYVVNRMKERSLNVKIGIIPAGTANDFSRAIGMSTDRETAARQIATGVVERLDCGCVNGLYFVNIFSFGIFTTTSQRTPDERKHKIGKLAYIIEGAKELRSMHTVPLHVVADGEEFDFNALMALVFNGETAGGFRLARRSSVKDGLFDCVLLERRNFFVSIAAMAQYLLRGKSPLVKPVRAKTITITSAVDEPTDVDGQKGAQFPLHIECLEGELQVVCPR